MKTVEIYVGGVCHGNPGDGGWAAVLRMGRHEKVLSGAEARTTFNRMDLLAMTGVLRVLIEPCAVSVHAPSRFLADGFARWSGLWTPRGWSSFGTRPVHNAELWHALIGLAQAHEVTFAQTGGDKEPDMARVLQLARKVAGAR